jgi:hypothetical protein
MVDGQRYRYGIARMKVKHCKRGHAYTDANTMMTECMETGKTFGFCVTCSCEQFDMEHGEMTDEAHEQFEKAGGIVLPHPHDEKDPVLIEFDLFS